ncbi:MAG TPA: hypothetical protein VF397_11170 [Pyrinomonadaceae bacterium]
MKTKAVLLIALFIGPLLTAALIVAKVKPTRVNRGFTLAIKITDYPAGSSVPILSATKVRYQRSDGNWKMETTYANGRVDAAFGQIGRGVFHVDENSKRLDYLSGLSPMDVNESRLRQLPGFVGEETILGVKCFHFHSTSDESGESFDSWIPPALQGFPLRTVSVAKSGAKNIHEVTEVIWGEPAFTTPDYPVDMRRYDEIHGPVSATRVK